MVAILSFVKLIQTGFSLKFLLILQELKSSGYATTTKVDRMDLDIKVQLCTNYERYIYLAEIMKTAPAGYSRPHRLSRLK